VRGATSKDGNKRCAAIGGSRCRIAMLCSRATSEAAQLRGILAEQGIEPPPALDVRDFLARENAKFRRMIAETGAATTP
jgi:hypothetical protein